MTKWRWVPLLSLLFTVIPCDTGIVLPDISSVLLESFQRLTRPPATVQYLWQHYSVYVSLVFALPFTASVRPAGPRS